MRTASNLTALEHIGSVRNAFADLEHWLYYHTSTTHKLHTIEVEQERRGREVLRLMLQAHIDSRGDGCVGDGLVGNPQGSSEEIVYRHKRLRSRRLITVFGPVPSGAWNIVPGGSTASIHWTPSWACRLDPIATRSSGAWSKPPSRDPSMKRSKNLPMPSA